MALVVDSVPMFLDHLWKQLKPVRDTLLALGLCYSLKKLAGLSRDVYVGFRVFGLSRLLPQPDLAQKYGKWAVVTGCTAGIGERFVHELAARGLSVVLISRSIEKLNLLAKKIEADYGVDTVCVAVDFSGGQSAVSTERLSDILESREGILVNNVGLAFGHPKFFDETPVDQYWAQMNVNIGSALALTRMVLPQMVGRGRGAVVNMGSKAALRPMPLLSTYSASKAYLQYWSLALATELKPHNIDVLLLEPSFVVTPMTMNRNLSASLRTPSAQTYATHAIQTLGWTRQTTGYWPHSLENYLLGCLFRIPDSGVKRMMLNVRNNVPNVTRREK